MSTDPTPRDACASGVTGSAVPGLAFARRVVVAVIGATLFALGAVLLVAPGPGLLVLSMGLGVLAIEFAWARRWLHHLRERAARLVATRQAPPGDSAKPS